jgi:hypothetical protein
MSLILTVEDTSFVNILLYIRNQGKMVQSQRGRAKIVLS